MTKHPLTEEMMEKIHDDEPGNFYPYDEGDMRAAYDKGCEKGRDNTLEKVCHWIFDNLGDPRLLDDIYLVVLDDNAVYDADDELLVGINTDSIVDNLYIAIHPEQENN